MITWIINNSTFEEHLENSVIYFLILLSQYNIPLQNIATVFQKPLLFTYSLSRMAFISTFYKHGALWKFTMLIPEKITTNKVVLFFSFDGKSYSGVGSSAHAPLTYDSQNQIHFFLGLHSTSKIARWFCEKAYRRTDGRKGGRKEGVRPSRRFSFILY